MWTVTSRFTAENRGITKTPMEDYWGLTDLATISVTEEFGNYRSSSLLLTVSGSPMLPQRADDRLENSIHLEIGSSAGVGNSVHTGGGSIIQPTQMSLSRGPVLRHSKSGHNWAASLIMLLKPTIEAKNNQK